MCGWACVVFLIEDAEMTFHPKNSGCSPDSEHDTGSHHTPHCCYHPFPSSPSPSTTTPSRRRYGSLPSYSPVARKNDRPPYTDLKAVALYAALAPRRPVRVHSSLNPFDGDNKDFRVAPSAGGSRLRLLLQGGNLRRAEITERFAVDLPRRRLHLHLLLSAANHLPPCLLLHRPRRRPILVGILLLHLKQHLHRHQKLVRR